MLKGECPVKYFLDSGNNFSNNIVEQIIRGCLVIDWQKRLNVDAIV